MTKRFHQVGVGVGGPTWVQTLTLNMSLAVKCLAEIFARMTFKFILQRAFTVGIGGPVGSGKTALVLALCRHLRDSHGVCVVTNDIFTR